MTTIERIRYEALVELLEEWADAHQVLVEEAGLAPVFAEQAANLIWEGLLGRHAPDEG